MNILVTGGKGFIGSHLIPALEKKGHTVRSYDLKDKQDILNIKQLCKAIDWSDVVYHLASLTDVQESLKYPEKYFQTNVQGSLRVIGLCMRLGKKIIFTSSASVYNAHSSPYAMGKLYIENVMANMFVHGITFRLFNVYGEGMNKTTMLFRFQRENPIIIYGDGKQTRDFIHIDDVVSILVSALYKKWDNKVMDVGTGKAQTVLSIAKKFKKPYVFGEQRQEVRESKANIKPLRKLYTKPFKKLEDYICDTQS